MLYKSALGYVSMQADRVGPYQPQVPGTEFGLGVRWRLALTSGVPERPTVFPTTVSGRHAYLNTNRHQGLHQRLSGGLGLGVPASLP
jgi:hypothetical protein